MVLNVERSGNRSVEGLQLPPGFRFYPTDEELVWHYLRRKADSEHFEIPIIADVDLYKFDPWDLPGMAYFGEKEWFFFSPRDRKYPNGKRPNRAAASGYWKATGTDKPIYRAHDKVGVKKSLVFYRGHAPKGDKTNWIMHEYRLVEGVAQFAHHHCRGSLRLDDWVLCRIYKKSTSRRDGESGWASLPEISDEGLMEGMLGADTNSEDGSLTATSLPMMNVVPGGGAGSTSTAPTNAWETQLQAMASTSRGPTLLDKTRFVQQLEASQSQLHMVPSMAVQFPSRSWNYSTYAEVRESFNPMATMIRSPISDDESQSTFQYEMEPSLCTPPLHDNNISLPRIPDNFSFAYGGDPGTLNYNL